MKNLSCVAALSVAAAGCSQETAEPETEATMAAEAPATPEMVMAADGQPTPGMYRITAEDGSILMEDLKADGTFVETTEAGEVTQTGRWVQKSPEQFCTTIDEQYVSEESPGGEQCHTEAVDADGTCTSTNPRGETVTVERVTA